MSTLFRSGSKKNLAQDAAEGTCLRKDVCQFHKRHYWVQFDIVRVLVRLQIIWYTCTWCIDTYQNYCCHETMSASNLNTSSYYWPPPLALKHPYTNKSSKHFDIFHSHSCITIIYSTILCINNYWLATHTMVRKCCIHCVTCRTALFKAIEQDSSEEVQQQLKVSGASLLNM